jgi:hypothetical protein
VAAYRLAIGGYATLAAEFPAVPEHRNELAGITSRLQAGQVAEAVAEVTELTTSAIGPAKLWYDLGCFYALASGKSAEKKQEYDDQAMNMLQKAVKAGWSDAGHMANDTDLDAIRRRTDFKKLIDELSNKSPAFPERKP